MTVTLAREMLFEVVQDIEPLLALHFGELATNQRGATVSPQWERYAALEQAGMYRIFTARKDGALIGYAGFYVMPHMHFADWISAVNDVLFLHPGHRTGRTGVRLITFCEKQAREAGATSITWHAKFTNHLSDILHGLGYVDEEIVMTKTF